VLELPYGENPHQRAAYYAQVGSRTHVLSMVSQLGGKQLSFNNVLDLDAGRLLLDEFQLPACVIVKHNNPCGVAVGGAALEADRRAFAADPGSAFGGVIAANTTVSVEMAETVADIFTGVYSAVGILAALAEREILLRAAPHLIRPLRFVLPLNPQRQSALLLRLGLLLYDWLGRRKILPGTRTLDLVTDPAGHARGKAGKRSITPVWLCRSISIMPEVAPKFPSI